MSYDWLVQHQGQGASRSLAKVSGVLFVMIDLIPVTPLLHVGNLDLTVPLDMQVLKL